MMKRKVLLVLLSLMMLLLCFCGIASAAPITHPPSEGQLSNDPHQSVVVNIHEYSSEKSTSLIKQWVCGISDNYNGTVTIMGETFTNGNVAYLDAKIYLQRWNGSSWVDVTSRTYSDTYNNYVSGSSIISVTRGDYYRTRGVHTANNAGIYDTQTSVSGAIQIQ